MDQDSRMYFKFFFSWKYHLNWSSWPETLQQIVINQFSRVAHNERCSFFGNVSLGSSISLSELRQIYHVVSWQGQYRLFDFLSFFMSLIFNLYHHISSSIRLCLLMVLKVTEFLALKERYVWLLTCWLIDTTHFRNLMGFFYYFNELILGIERCTLC